MCDFGCKGWCRCFLWFHLFVLFLRFVLGVYLMLFVFCKKETSKNIVFL